MCAPRKLTLLVMAVVSVAALVAPPAFAQEPLIHNQNPELEARAEPGGILCPAVTPSPAPSPAPTTTAGGCRVHVAGRNIVLFQHVFGFEFLDSTCDTEFDARLDSSAEGYLTHAELTQGTQGVCTKRPCGSTAPTPESRAWSVYASEVAAGQETVTILFCLWETDDTENIHCEVTLPFTEREGGVPVNHRYHVIASPEVGCHGSVPGFGPELTGEWNAEMVLGTNGESQSEQHVEVNHVL